MLAACSTLLAEDYFSALSSTFRHGIPTSTLGTLPSGFPIPRHQEGQIYCYPYTRFSHVLLHTQRYLSACQSDGDLSGLLPFSRALYTAFSIRLSEGYPSLTAVTECLVASPSYFPPRRCPMYSVVISPNINCSSPSSRTCNCL